MLVLISDTRQQHYAMLFRMGRNKMHGVIGRMKNMDHQEKLCKLCDREITQLVRDEFPQSKKKMKNLAS
jgi:hypothetical protein